MVVASRVARQRARVMHKCKFTTQQVGPTVIPHWRQPTGDSRPFPAGCAYSSRPDLWTRGTSPEPVGSPRPGFYPDASSCNRSPGVGSPASSNDAERNHLEFL